jgi:hypothetical protein
MAAGASPLFPLSEVKALAVGANFVVAFRPGVNRIRPHVGEGTVTEAIAFARAVVLELAAGDFAERKGQRNAATGRTEWFDVYCPQLKAVFLELHDTASNKTTWYLKLKIQREKDGRVLFVLSCHCLLESQRLADGTTRQAKWKESE